MLVGSLLSLTAILTTSPYFAIRKNFKRWFFHGVILNHHELLKLLVTLEAVSDTVDYGLWVSHSSCLGERVHWPWQGKYVFLFPEQLINCQSLPWVLMLGLHSYCRWTLIEPLACFLTFFIARPITCETPYWSLTVKEGNYNIGKKWLPNRSRESLFLKSQWPLVMEGRKEPQYPPAGAFTLRKRVPCWSQPHLSLLTMLSPRIPAPFLKHHLPSTKPLAHILQSNLILTYVNISHGDNSRGALHFTTEEANQDVGIFPAKINFLSMNGSATVSKRVI